jgi:hypothetical protein
MPEISEARATILARNCGLNFVSVFGATLRSRPKSGLGSLDVVGLQTLWSLFDLEAYPGSFLQRTISVAHDRGVVDEYVIAAFTLDKSVALRGVKPLNNTLFLHAKKHPLN